MIENKETMDIINNIDTWNFELSEEERKELLDKGVIF